MEAAEALERRGITAYELAARIGAAHGTVYRLVKRDNLTRISMETLAQLCDALDCAPGTLLTLERR